MNGRGALSYGSLDSREYFSDVRKCAKNALRVASEAASGTALPPSLLLGSFSAGGCGGSEWRRLGRGLGRRRSPRQAYQHRL